MFAWMAFSSKLLFQPKLEPNQMAYWCSMQVAMVVGFFTAFPPTDGLFARASRNHVNRTFVRSMPAVLSEPQRFDHSFDSRGRGKNYGCYERYPAFYPTPTPFLTNPIGFPPWPRLLGSRRQGQFCKVILQVFDRK